MAIRGTAMIINEDTISIGPEFNGDMYPHGHGDQFIKNLSEVTTPVEFVKFNNSFNKHNFGYDKIMSCYQGELENEEIIKDGKYSMNLIISKNGAWVTSDWLFIKNITSKQIKLVDRKGKIINVSSNETIRLYFGELIENGVNHRIK